jgi:neuronal guanine nucleotide exchange factor
MLWLHLLFSGTISPHQKKLQEAKFEIITSEASYINSLNVLEKHFISSLEMCDESVLSKNDRRILFSNLIPGNLADCITFHLLS